jgi:hypothetical protein
MKNQTIDLSSFKGLQELSVNQIISYAAGVTAKVIYTFAKDAVTYQQSLPPNLKK